MKSIFSYVGNMQLIFATISVAFSLGSPRSLPPRQSEYQKNLMMTISEKARTGSRAGQTYLHEAIQNQGFRTRLSALLPESSGWEPDELLQRFRDEVAVTEIIHNLPARIPFLSNPIDVDVPFLAKSLYLPNQWELAFLEPNRTEPGTLMEWMVPAGASEVGLFGSQPFTGKNPFGFRGLGGWPASFEEAAQRLVYTSFNLLRVDTGVAEFGAVGLVLNRQYVSNMTVLSPMDTGDFSDMCNASFTKALCMQASYNQSFCAKFWFCIWSHGSCKSIQEASGKFASPGCDKWDHTPGTLYDFDHLILSNVKFWNSTNNDLHRTARLDWRDNLALQMARMLGPWEPQPLVQMPEAFHEHYWEANTLGTVVFPIGVHFVIADFTRIFGTEDGQQLQQLCNKWGWALVWALGPNLNQTASESTTYISNYTFPANKRLLDPSVLKVGGSGGNSSVAFNISGIGPKSVQVFQEHWAEARAVRRERLTNSSYPYPLPEQLAIWWDKLASALGSALRVQPLRWTSCTDSNNCIGTNWMRDCICYKSQVAEDAATFVV